MTAVRPVTPLLAELAWPHVADCDDVLLVPVGSCEQHGPHLPADTDTRIAVAVAHGFGDGALLAPEVSYGASGEHEQFPSTVSIGTDVLHTVLVEYGRSACRWARRLVFVNGHGGNLAALRSAVAQLRYEQRDVAWFGCQLPDADAHAGHHETSLLLAIAPEVVDMSRAATGNTTPLSEMIDSLRQGDLAKIAPTGVLGDPTTANEALGRRLLAELRTQLRDAVASWAPDRVGRIT